jgi:hypothetical protein
MIMKVAEIIGFLMSAKKVGELLDIIGNSKNALQEVSLIIKYVPAGTILTHDQFLFKPILDAFDHGCGEMPTKKERSAHAWAKSSGQFHVVVSVPVKNKDAFLDYWLNGLNDIFGKFLADNFESLVEI